MIRRLGLLLAAFAMAATAPAPARADLRPFGPPKASYTADSRMVADGQTLEAHLVAAGAHERREMTVKGMRQVLIIDHERGGALMLFLDQRMAMDVPVEAALGPVGGKSLRWETTPLGPATVAGVATTRHRVHGTNGKGMTAEGTVWLTAQSIAMRAELTVTHQGRRHKVSQELRNLRIGPVDPKLFAVPPGFSRIAVDGGARRR